MRKYYLFTIKKEYYEVYKKSPLVLYKTLENLYRLRKEDLNYGLTLYNQICDIIDVDRLINYFAHIKEEYINNRYLIRLDNELTIFEFHYACIICKSKKNFPDVFKILNYYNKYIFVCDFSNKDYFFLGKTVISTGNKKYNYA